MNVSEILFFNFAFAGKNYAGVGRIGQENMKSLMKKYRVPDDEVEKLFGIETIADGVKQITLESASSETIYTETDKPVEPLLVETGGAITTTESSFTGNELMPKPSSSGTTIGIDDSRAVTTTDAAFLLDTSGSEE